MTVEFSEHIQRRDRGEEVYQQMFINNISGGTIDASGNLTNLIVTGEIYNVKSGAEVNAVMNGKSYPAVVSGREFTATIPAIDLQNIPSGEINITVESPVSATLPLTINGAYSLSITATMTANTVDLATLVDGYIVGTYTNAAGVTYSLTGDTSSYYDLDGGDIVLNAAGESAFNNTSLAHEKVIVTIKATDGTGREVYKTIASYISDPVEFVEPAPTKPAFLKGTWNLTFQDEFTADHVRDDHWVLKRGTAGLGYNAMDSVEIENDNLVLMTQVDPKAHDCEYQHFAGCEITTLDKFAQQYGYFECRAKGNSIRGSWPAFWLMPDRGERGQVAQDRKMLMSFDLSSVTEEIESAVLTYNVSSATITKTENGEQITEDVTAGVQLFNFKEWDGATVEYNDIKKMPFRVISDDDVVAGSSVNIDISNELVDLVAEKYHCMLADNYMTTERVNIYSKDADLGLRPVLTINGSTKIYPYQDGSLRAGDTGSSVSREFNTGAETCEIFDSWANYEATNNGGMEVDIWENLGIWGADVNAHALHWDGYGSSHKGTNSGHIDMGTTEDGYHTYGVLWDEDGLQFYIDGDESWYRSFTPDEDSDDIRAFNVPAYILLSMQTGGWDGNNEQIDSDSLPAKAYFDYVRVWEKSE